MTNCARNSTLIEFQALREIGGRLPAIIRGDANALEILMKDDMLSQIYTHSIGIDVYLDEIARITHQISHRYPHLNVLEIGQFIRPAPCGFILIPYRSWRRWNFKTRH